jgi:hypothetical protein
LRRLLFKEKKQRARAPAFFSFRQENLKLSKAVPTPKPEEVLKLACTKRRHPEIFLQMIFPYPMSNRK